MNRKDRIDLSIIMIVFLLIVSLYTYVDYKEEVSVAERREQELLQTQANPQFEESYYLSELSGYVVVYMSDKKTIYEYTNILVNELPENIQVEIRNGMNLNSLQEVYGFLENYSS